MKKIPLFFCLFGISSGALALDQKSTLQKQLTQLGLENVVLTSSPISGIEMAKTDNGIFYISQDGKYLLDGKMYALSPKGVINITNKMLLKELDGDKHSMIIFPAKQEKYVVTAFIDITCHYCHLMFEQTKAYNELGITVRYLPFPRKGLNAISAQQMEAIWTSPDPTYALTQAEIEKKFPEKMKTPNVVKKQYILAEQLGINGVPALILDNGEVIGGYIPPERLLHLLSK